jgi:hypothetical protein
MRSPSCEAKVCTELYFLDYVTTSGRIRRIKLSGAGRVECYDPLATATVRGLSVMTSCGLSGAALVECQHPLATANGTVG